MPIIKSARYDEEEETGSTPETEGENDNLGAVALLPKSVLMGKDVAVGDQVILTVTGIHDDEIQVEYKTGEEEAAPAEEETLPEEAAPAPEEPAEVPEGAAYE